MALGQGGFYIALDHGQDLLLKQDNAYAKPDMCEALYLKMESRRNCGLVPKCVRFSTTELVVVFYVV